MSGAMGLYVIVKVRINVQFTSKLSRVKISAVPYNSFSDFSDEDRDTSINPLRTPAALALAVWLVIPTQTTR